MEGASQADLEHRPALRVHQQSHHERPPLERRDQSAVWNLPARVERVRLESVARKFRSADRIGVGSVRRPQDSHPRGIRHLLRSDPRAHLRVRLLLQSALRAGVRAAAAVPESLSRRAAAAGAVGRRGLLPECHAAHVPVELHNSRPPVGDHPLKVRYVGSRGLHLYAARDINPVQPSIVNGVQVFGVPKGPASVGILSNPRLNPKAAALSSEAPVGDSNYHSLQVGLNRRFSHGVQGQLSYTWSKCLDDASGTYGLEGGIPWSNPLNGSFDHGRCLFDRPQVLNLSGLYALPFQKNRLVRGWQASGSLIVQSGSPWNVLVGFDQSGGVVAGSERPNIVMPADQILIKDVNRWANVAGFSLPAPGTLGNLQRDFLTGPGTVNTNFAVLKDTSLNERFRLQFRSEFFNLFNHANFALPNPNVFVQTTNGGGVPNPTFGKITATTTSSRQIQFALKLLF